MDVISSPMNPRGTLTEERYSRAELQALTDFQGRYFGSCIRDLDALQGDVEIPQCDASIHSSEEVLWVEGIEGVHSSQEVLKRGIEVSKVNGTFDTSMANLSHRHKTQSATLSSDLYDLRPAWRPRVGMVTKSPIPFEAGS